MTAALEVQSLDVPFGDGPGLVGISIDVPENGRFALVGPSGSGKTSFLRALAGSGRATAGTVWVAGADVTGLPPDRRSTVLLSQRPLLFPHMSVFENVAFPLRVRGARGCEVAAQVRRVLESVRIADLGPRAPAALSGGQAHRVALARAVVARPRVLLLDEPLSSLDPALREDVRRAILDVQAEYGPAMVWVTHDLEEAGRSSDRVAVLLDGRIAQVGTPEDIFRRPQSAAVARFLGLPNELPGAVDEAGRVILHGRLVRSEGPSAPCTVSARPRRGVTVIFGAEGARLVPPGEGDVPAHVLSVHHHPRGATVRVHVPVEPAGVATSPAAASTCEISVSPERVPRPGQTVGLALDAQRLHVFPAEGSPASARAALTDLWPDESSGVPGDTNP